jgi:hypothetical protein
MILGPAFGGSVSQKFKTSGFFSVASAQRVSDAYGLFLAENMKHDATEDIVQFSVDRNGFDIESQKQSGTRRSKSSLFRPFVHLNDLGIDGLCPNTSQSQKI